MSGGHDGTPQEPQWPSNPYFGEPWDAPAVEGARRAPTPVGQPCADCTMPIADGDQGFLIPRASRTADERRPASQPWHRECLMRTVVGSPDCIDGTCHCRSEDADACEPTPQQRRAEAIEVWNRIQSGQFGRHLSGRAG